MRRNWSWKRRGVARTHRSEEGAAKSSAQTQSKTVGSFGALCHAALLRELARLAGSSEGTDSLAEAFDGWMAKAEAVSREAVRVKIDRGESLSPVEMLVCQVHAFGNGLAIGERKNLESVPLAAKRITPIGQGGGLCTATRLRGTLFRVA